MESNISFYGRRIQKLGKDFKECGAWTAVKEVVDTFKKTMPLLTDLRNPALRQRHWNHLMESVGETFDPHSDSFTLAKVLSLRLDQYSELISNISNNATKELNLEQSLEQIKKTWDELELDIVPCRERKEAYKLKSTDDIFATL
jgi:dynein heavy chain